ALREVVLQQLAEVHYRASQPIQFYDQQGLCLPRREHLKRLLESRTVQSLRARSSVNNDVDKLQLVELRIGSDLRRLRFAAHPFVCLLFGAAWKVSDCACCGNRCLS